MPGKFRLSQASIEEPKSESPKRARRSSTMKSKPMPTPPSPHSKKRVSLTGSSENLSVKEGNLANSRQGSSGMLGLSYNTSRCKDICQDWTLKQGLS